MGRRAGRAEGALSAEIVALYDEYAAKLLTWFYSRTCSWETARDLTAETFAAAIEGFGRFDPRRGEAGAWLWGIARNKLRRYHETGAIEARARVRLQMRTPRAHEDDLAAIDLRVDAERITPQVLEHLDGLGENLAAAVRARVLEDKPYDVVATELGCSQGAARVRVSRALSILLDALDGQRDEVTP